MHVQDKNKLTINLKKVGSVIEAIRDEGRVFGLPLKNLGTFDKVRHIA